MELNNIQSYQNNLDVVMKNSTLEKGKKIGYVRYKDGEHIIYRYWLIIFFMILYNHPQNICFNKTLLKP